MIDHIGETVVSVITDMRTNSVRRSLKMYESDLTKTIEQRGLSLTPADVMDVALRHLALAELNAYLYHGLHRGHDIEYYADDHFTGAAQTLTYHAAEDAIGRLRLLGFDADADAIHHLRVMMSCLTTVYHRQRALTRRATVRATCALLSLVGWVTTTVWWMLK